MFVRLAAVTLGLPFFLVSYLSYGSCLVWSPKNIEVVEFRSSRVSPLTLVNGGFTQVLEISYPVTTHFAGTIGPVRDIGISKTVRKIFKSPWVVQAFHKELFRVRRGSPQRIRDIRSVLATGRRYTIDIFSEKMLLAPKARGRIRGLLSKHVYLSGRKKLLFSGEIWLDSEGVLHIANASGSYQPTEEQMGQAKNFFEDMFNIPVQTHHYQEIYEQTG